ncbi:class II glutamine amidotransferase [Ideonella azotifigens]|uniref:Glutamine amidotransferase type-2 domain-containing protein n=1 Tax=Ideonella azotifigens TaxID=513160 RepID=A0ABN1KEQ7_9BURK|nr:class II glutamine amidotransferase [Ideonella azotifigens]MCD2340674.1 class II glutamine amidotransferase [Ideonella azotifigens]
MCLIIKKPRGRQITADFLENAWRGNHDGWGFFYLDGSGHLATTKGMQLNELLALNQGLPLDCEVYLHLRKATYGHVNHEMAHPYQVREGLMLMHNGSIEHLAPTDTRRSDTSELARMLACMFDGLTDAQVASMMRSEGFNRLITPAIKGSMVVLLDREGAVRLGRDWHVVQPREWNGVMPGIEVSNTHAWAPLWDLQTPAWRRVARKAWQWLTGRKVKLVMQRG